jgi:hypothetical protein
VITLSPYRRKHILQHFHGSEEAGSVFHAECFPTPEDLLRYLNERKPFEVKAEFAEREVWLYNANEFASIGTLGLAKRSDIADVSIVSLQRGKFIHEVALVEKLPLTSFIYVVVKRSGEHYNLITAFPGNIAAPFPSRKQSPHKRKLSVAFWKEHVLLKVKA